MQDSQRTHDLFYAQEDRRANPKEYFKFVVELTRRTIGGLNGLNILDIGCAGGDFLWYLKDRFPKANLYGIDVLDALVQLTRSKVAGAEARLADITSPEFSDLRQYDVVYMMGVHSIFDSCEHWTTNVSALLTDGGTAFIFGIFNPYPYDVLVRIRRAGESGRYEQGWNVLSRESVAAGFGRQGRPVEFVSWQMPLAIEPNVADPLRSWTAPMADGSYLVTNATRVIHDFYCAIVGPRTGRP